MGRALNLPNFSESGLLFVPRRWERVVFVKWLKRVHAWTGFWGALLFFLLGLSGVLLNHRNVLKIDTGKPREVSALNVAVDPGLITDEKALGTWAKEKFDLATEPRTPRREAPEGGGKARFLGTEHTEAPRWVQAFTHTNGLVTVEYVPGSASVSVKQEAQNFLGFIKNLHKGTGLGVGWVLFIDTIAGALIVMALSGFLLWSRLHGPRLLAGGIVIGSLTLALSMSWGWLL
jgi:uncharacterized protein